MFQRVEDLFCQTVRYTRYFSNFFHAGFLQPLQTAHIFQQHLSAFWSDPFNGFQRAGAFYFCPFFTVAGNGVIVRLVANMLNHMQRGGIRRQAKALAFRFEE